MGGREIYVARRIRRIQLFHSQLNAVITYVKNQEKHHSHTTFEDEYLELLNRFDVAYNPKYVFDMVQNSAPEM